ncbi:hypothetical protein B296_00035564 [Ensete ventricosum]|uniref:Uncharacterized protein n=1 Tax=Ensete ventricosum TaxID=4639 RepID=A0A426YBU1_ENSVE|nr:hypothetical protein B296_00035564 [Ensete ventricosum]
MTVKMANATDESLARDYKQQCTTEKPEETMQVIDVLNFQRCRSKGEVSRREIAHETRFNTGGRHIGYYCELLVQKLKLPASLTVLLLV